MNLRSFSLACLLIGYFTGASAQYDFNKYTTLQAQGAVPADFLVPTYQKIQDRLMSESPELQRNIDHIEYLRNNMYLNDFFLHSGYVVYGDPVSEHVKRVADRVLKNRPELREKLRFYTLKSDETNVFVTEEGIVFVSTGLISQLENDAQLAFMLAHEIAHFEQDKLEQAAIWSQSPNEKNPKVRLMSQYSVENELLADSLALDFYLESGFSAQELLTTLDVLAYSYLPFDEITIDPSYFASDSMFVPQTVFPDKSYPITDLAHIDESESTYTNIGARRKALQSWFKSTSGSAGELVFVEDEAQFNRIRTIARFESLRCQVLFAKYAKAIYSIYILEQKFPESAYLRHLKAQCWFGLYQYNREHVKSQTYLGESKYEGESAKVHYMLKKMENEELTVMAIRTVYDLYRQSPDDEELRAIYQRLCRELAFDQAFNPDDYSTLSFSEANETIDSLKVQDVLTDRRLTKYERIKRKKQLGNTDELDSSRYYVYGLHDVLKDSAFMTLYRKNYADYRLESEKEEAQKATGGQERIQRYKKYPYEDIMIAEKRFIVMEPQVICRSSEGVDHERSEYLEKSFRKAFEVAAAEAGTGIRMVSAVKFGEGGTEMFNERNVLATRLGQSLNNEKIRSFPVDFTLMQDLISRSGTSKVLFSATSHIYSVELNYWLIASSLVFTISAPFIIPVHLSDKVLGGNDTRITVLVLDLETGEVPCSNYSTIEAPLTTYNISAYLYLMFKRLGSEAP